MTYTIELQRVAGLNVVQGQLVLITKDQAECFEALRTLTLMLETNKTFIESGMKKTKEACHYYIVYDFQRK